MYCDNVEYGSYFTHYWAVLLKIVLLLVILLQELRKKQRFLSEHDVMNGNCSGIFHDARSQVLKKIIRVHYSYSHFTSCRSPV